MLKIVLTTSCLLTMYITGTVSLKKTSNNIVGFGSFTEYYKGSSQSPLILVVPHGGYKQPPDLPVRDAGCYDAPTGLCKWSHLCGVKDAENCKVAGSQDEMTWQVAWKISQQIHNRTGHIPHVVVNHLHPRYFDPDTDIDLGTFGENAARRAWIDFHHYLTDARGSVSSRGPGLVVDLHSHAHTSLYDSHIPISQGHALPQDWIELGYLVTALQLDTGRLDPRTSSIRSLTYRTNPSQFEAILRGNQSLGVLLQQRGHKVMPSPDLPNPGINNTYQPYGYIVKRYGSSSGGRIDAVRVTLPADVIRRKSRYVASLALALTQFLEVNYKVSDTSSNIDTAGFHTSAAIYPASKLNIVTTTQCVFIILICILREQRCPILL